MSFGYRDKDWVDPDDERDYEGVCSDCALFEECPCGCGWGHCGLCPGEFLDGGVDGCERGCPR